MLTIDHSSSVADLQRCYVEVNADLKRIYDWAGSNGLKLNPKKSQVILIQRRGTGGR
jgi:cell division protein FtsL